MTASMSKTTPVSLLTAMTDTKVVGVCEGFVQAVQVEPTRAVDRALRPPRPPPTAARRPAHGPRDAPPRSYHQARASDRRVQKHPAQRQVVGFGTAAGEDHFGRLATEAPGRPGFAPFPALAGPLDPPSARTMRCRTDRRRRSPNRIGSTALRTSGRTGARLRCSRDKPARVVRDQLGTGSVGRLRSAELPSVRRPPPSSWSVWAF